MTLNPDNIPVTTREELKRRSAKFVDYWSDPRARRNVAEWNAMKAEEPLVQAEHDAAVAAEIERIAGSHLS